MKFKEILRKIFFLPPLPTLIIAVFGFGFVIAVAAFKIEIPALQYLSYISSAYALTVTITGFPRFSELPFIKKIPRHNAWRKVFQRSSFSYRVIVVGRTFHKLFNYTYSASQQEEIKKIRDKYSTPKQAEDKMEQLRRLDKSVTKPGTVISLIVGVISSLILGTGMSMCMVWGDEMFFIGIIIGVVGMIGIICAYPLYSSITKVRREKLAAEIIRLSNELMK